ncbi:MAG: hypothetical protein JXB39_14755 [Deltaproteobacteria bacterium]|nr:hypothetical protein [Deltaproteobacteria bacterium]
MDAQGGNPRITLRFASEGPGTHAFSPLLPAGTFTLDPHEVDLDALERLDVRFEADLRPGTVQVAQVAGASFPLEVPGGCRARGRVRTDRRNAGDGRAECAVTAAEVSFDPPLALPHILPTLVRLRTLFEDRALRDLLGRVNRVVPAGRVRQEIGARAPPLERLLPTGGTGRARIRRLGRHLVEGLRPAARVLLTRIHAQPVLHGGTWALEMRFGGILELLGHAPVPFREVRLPTWLLPEPHASLRRLLSADPLATATLRRNRVPVEGVLEALGDVLDGLSGQVEARADLPALTIQSVLPDGTELWAEAAGLGSVALQTRFEAHSSPDRLRLRVRETRLELAGGHLAIQGRCEVWPDDASDPDRSFAAIAAARLARGTWPEHRARLCLEAQVLPESNLGALDLTLAWKHPLLHGGGHLALSLSEMGVLSRLRVEIAPGIGSGRTEALDLGLRAKVAVGEGSRVDAGRLGIDARRIAGWVQAQVHLEDPDAACLEVRGETGLDVAVRRTVEAFPELDLPAGDLEVDLTGRAAFTARACTRPTGEDLVEVDFDGTSLGLDVDRADARLGNRRLHLPGGARVDARVVEATIDTSGLGRSRFEASWDLHGASAVLNGPGGTADLLPEDLWTGAFTLAISPAGGIAISGRPSGIHDARTLNALLHPDQELQRWIELLDHDEALDHPLAAARAFGGELAGYLEQAHALARRVRAALRAEGIRQAGDLLPSLTLARVISRILTGSPDLWDRWLGPIQRVTAGDGLDVPATRQILEEVLPLHDRTWDLDGVLRILALLLAPTEPVAPCTSREILPLAESPRWVRTLSGLPRPAEVYAVLSSPDPPPEGFLARLSRVSPYLTYEQMSWIVQRLPTNVEPADEARLRFVHALKRRTRMIAESAGGLGYAPQASAIGLFLGATVRRQPLPGEPTEPLAGEPEGLLAHPSCLLGPEDVGVLLQAGLSAPLQGRAVQLNQRFLLDLVLAEPPAFSRHVLLAMGQGSPRILAAVLNGLLDLEQDAIRLPLDVPARLSERLGVALPRRADFMAGGRWARRSYYEALNQAAERILDESEAYEALCAWLQVERNPRETLPPPGDRVAGLEARARTAVEHADRAGARCRFRGSEPRRRRDATQAYAEAFSACATLLEAEPRAFQWPWYKAFFSRNYEALEVLSVVRNVQEGVDRTREWLARRLSHPVPVSEQALLDAVVTALYDREEDREALKADPLVRLLIDPPPGRYDFTVVSCMGVITEGARGEELAAAFRRLEERRGIPVIRADTATVRSLDFNAARIEEAVRRVQTPWGYIGYSQGCANGLWAETRMLGGTPEQQALVRGLRCRHFLYSAINGSAHGTCGDLKFLRATIQAEHLLSRYENRLSTQAIHQGLRYLRILLGSKAVVRTVAGIESLSHEGVLALSRECQIRGDAPTTSCRGRVRPEVLPDALAFLANQLTRQIESEEHDTQVAVPESVGHPVHVSNPMAILASACDIGARVQTAHHWSPLQETTAFVATANDRERCIYDTPKDRHVFPWIEVNARFGIIRRCAGH